VVGIDNSARQLQTARRLAGEHGIELTLHHGIAEDVPEHPLAVLTAPLDGSIPSGTQLLRPWFGGYRYDWRDAVDEPGGSAHPKGRRGGRTNLLVAAHPVIR
jgi:hypothetical protein